ncbi:hydrolase [Lentzea sp. NBRC 105346]|uniref:alpha/beta fold hydrolase n=1 Tax=Lentzea sp. NBRC 105346 TaxID=3032205 RepID=UPI0024A5EA3A|nr:alpha/beta hydrolase [Lentzea sp. NBRC 105346]GLZ29985.1 hydrolase [Lentzea sp. NBRC 105346]
MDIVITHGVQTVADHWAEVAGRLPGDVTVPNRRGRLQSEPHGESYGLRTEIDDLHQVLDTKSNPVLIGHSYGGLIAFLTAAERDDLTALVLYEPVVPVDGPFARDALRRIEAAMDRDDLDEAFSILAVDLVGDPPMYVELFRAKDPRGWAEMLGLMAGTFTELRAVDAFDYDPSTPSRIKVPTLLLLGETSDRPELIYGRAARVLEQDIENATLEVLPRQGHIAHRLAPELLADRINRFLAATTGTRDSVLEA